jgi:hypothetical protein
VADRRDCRSPALARAAPLDTRHKDAHGLYAQSGFKPLQAPERFMERFAG